MEFTGNSKFSHFNQTSESSSSSSSEGSTATPVKFPFSFPMPKTPIFIPPKNEPPESEESPLQERAKDHTQEQTSTPSASGLGRGSVGIGRGSRTTDASPSTDVSTRFSGLGRGTISREPRPDSINASGRRSSTGAVELPGEFGLGQRRDWPARASGAAALTREPGQRRLSDLGMTRNLMGSTDSPGLSRAFSEPRLFSDDRQRPLTKEEKLLALQLDRQLERRLELERQLERERELEKELERQLEKRKQKSDLGRFVNELGPTNHIGHLLKVIVAREHPLALEVGGNLNRKTHPGQYQVHSAHSLFLLPARPYLLLVEPPFKYHLLRLVSHHHLDFHLPQADRDQSQAVKMKLDLSREESLLGRDTVPLAPLTCLFLHLVTASVK